MPLTTESAARKDRTTGQGAELQHRHFAFIAATLADCRPPGSTRAAMAKHAHWRETVEQFAAACAASNPRFDRKRFLAACAY